MPRVVRPVSWIIFVCLVLALGFGAIHAQDDVAGLLKQAVAYLSKKLGKPITSVDTYTYETLTFADASLDCPEPGKVYAPNPAPGYKFLITVGGITYDVRITVDSTVIQYCTDAPIKQTSSLAVHRNQQYSIPYPDTWHITDKDKDSYFGLSQAPICSQPGMLVTALGPVPANKTSDSLLDEYAQTPNPNAVNAKFDSNRSPIGSIGRSVLYTAPCADGSTRASRISVFVAYGRGFRVWQFAPQKAFDQWADVYRNILDGFSPAPVSPASGQPMILPRASPLAMIIHVFAGNVYIGTLTDIPGTAVTTDAASDHVYSNPVPSPAGNAIAFVDPANTTLYVADAKNGQVSQPRKLADSVVAGYPPAWKFDGSEVAYVASGDTGNFLVAAKTDGSGTRKIGQVAGSQNSNAGCSDNTTDPAEELYWSVTGPAGNELLLAWTRSNVLYFSPGCNGLGVSQISDSATNNPGPQLVSDSLRRVRVSPDGTQLLGLIGDQQNAKLVRLQLAEHQAIEVPTSATPDHAVWSPDGKGVYYSTATLNQTIKLDADTDKDRGLKDFGIWPFQTATYDVTLHGVNLATGTDTQLFKLIARSIVQIAPSPDGTGLLFTVIQDASGLTEAFKNNVSASDMRRQAPTTLLYWLPFTALTPAQPQLVAVTTGQTWGPLGSGLAPTPTGSPNQKIPTPSKPLPTPVPGATNDATE